MDLGVGIRGFGVLGHPAPTDSLVIELLGYRTDKALELAEIVGCVLELRSKAAILLTEIDE